MAETNRKERLRLEPRGFGEHTRRSSSENAHEQGWGLNWDERTKVAQGKQGDDDYGAQEFGETAVNTSDSSAGPKTQT
jgi:hypothetical protein